MKKLIISCAVVMTAVCAQAQLFVGGTLGFDYTAGKTVAGSITEKGDATITIEFSPMVGFSISDNFAVGVQAGIGLISTNDRATEPKKDNTTFWEFAPFARYTLVSSGDFSLLAEGSLGLYGKTGKTTRGGVSTDDPSTVGFGLSVMPIVSYSMTERLSLELRPNLFKFALGLETTKAPGSSDYKDVDTFFGFGANPSTLPLVYRLSNLSFLEVGMIFKF